MKTKLFYKIITMLVVFITFSGCVTFKRTDLVKEGVVSVNRISTKQADISTIHLHKSKNKTEISVFVNFRGAYRRFSHGHVDITVYAPDKSVLNKTITGSRYIHARRGVRGAINFRARIPGDVPDGSTIQAVYHKGFVKPECKAI